MTISSCKCRRRASKGTSNQQDADCDDLDDEEQFLNLDDVLEGQSQSYAYCALSVSATLCCLKEHSQHP